MLRRLLVVLLLAVSLHAQERTYRVPFHSAKGFVLLDTTLNGKPAVLLLDTGAPISFTLDGDGIELKGKNAFRTAGNVGVAYYKPPIKFDGVLGEDILRKFSAVRIDYKAGLVEFEQ